MSLEEEDLLDEYVEEQTSKNFHSLIIFSLSISSRFVLRRHFLKLNKTPLFITNN